MSRYMASISAHNLPVRHLLTFVTCLFSWSSSKWGLTLELPHFNSSRKSRLSIPSISPSTDLPPDRAHANAPNLGSKGEMPAKSRDSKVVAGRLAAALWEAMMLKLAEVRILVYHNEVSVFLSI